MAALLSLFIVLSISLTIVRIGTVILKMTGLSYDVAKFQARSAFTGTGFTTHESETIMNHPLRRNVILALMFVRNVGFVTVISSLVLSFVDIETTESGLMRIGLLAAGVSLIFLISRSKLFDNILRKMVELALQGNAKVYVSDYENLLNLAGEYEVIKTKIGEDNWIANKSLAELKLSDEGLLILGVKRPDGHYIGIPRGETEVYPEDTVVLYGREASLRLICDRKSGPEGDLQHKEQVAILRKMTGQKIETGKKSPLGFFKKLFGRKKK